MIITLKKTAQEQVIVNKLYEELFKSTIDIIVEDFRGSGYRIIKEYTRGASLGIKRAVLFDETKFFIKIVEKVARENQVYDNRFYRDNKIFLNKIEKYCFHPGVLVLPFYEGKCLDEFLFSSTTSLSNKIGKIQYILNTTLDLFWLQNIKRGNNNLIWAENYIKGRMDSLINDIDSIEIDDKTIPAADFLSMSVRYLSAGKKYDLPPIKKMVEDVIILFYNYRPQFTSCVTADFQPPNIITSDDGFKHIDLSNSEANGDIAIDIGKFFNFITRFYRVSFLRDGVKLGNALKPIFKVNQHNLSLEIDIAKGNNFKNVAPYIEERFALKAASLSGDFHLIDRITLYKFVVNLITIRRHLNYRGLQDLLFANLIDSYAEIYDKILNI